MGREMDEIYNEGIERGLKQELEKGKMEMQQERFYPWPILACRWSRLQQ